MPNRQTKLRAADAAVEKIIARCAADPHYFIFGGRDVGGFLKTKDEHDRNSRKPFPNKRYLHWALSEWHYGPPVVYTAKSRQLMISWLLAAYGLWTVLFRPDSLVPWQTKKLEDAAPFIYEKNMSQARMSVMLAGLPDWLRVCRMPGGGFQPLCGADPKELEQYCSYANITLPNGSQVLGLAQGASQVEGKVPTVFISDESSLQEEWESAMAAVGPTIQGDAKLLAVGTMRLPSAYGDEISPSWNVDPDQCGRGLARFRTTSSAYGIRIHYSADPDKDPETEVGAAWKRGQLESGTYGKQGEQGWRWQQHMEINPLARSGTLCIPKMREFLDEDHPRIVVPNMSPAETFGWSFDAGLDWGTLCRAVFLVFGMRPDGRRFLLHEISVPGSEVGGIPGFCEEIKQSPWFHRVNGSIWADPTLWNKDQNTLKGGLVDKATIFDLCGVTLVAAKANGQDADDVALDRLNEYYWGRPEDPLLFICENAVWTLKHWPALMFEEWSEDKAHERSPKEKMKDLHVDEWDAFKYAEVAWPEVPKYLPRHEPGTFGWWKASGFHDQRRAQLAKGSGNLR